MALIKSYKGRSPRWGKDCYFSENATLVGDIETIKKICAAEGINPDKFELVQEADENTHRIEVTVLDTDSGDALTCFSNSQIQATALSVNALLNPDVNTVIYHVNVYVDEDGNFRTSRFFEFLRPTGETHAFVTFVWTKSTTTEGRVVFNCTVTGMDSKTQKALRDRITSAHTPYSLITDAITDDSAEGEQTDGTSTDGAAVDDGVFN